MAKNRDYKPEDILFPDQAIITNDLVKEMETSFMEYSMSVIVDRALPDVRDGLKPVHRRILYALWEDGLTSDKPFRKSATCVGDVIGRYHPHGDASVYDAMVRLAQDFSMRCKLVDGHGNFGSIDGDPPAAYRYTEARMSRLANEMLRDIDKQVIDWVPNFDANPQCSYDHREDIALFLNGFMRNRRLEALEAAYKQLHAQTVLFAGPAVVETFGETPFSPVRNAGVPVLNRRQRKEMAEYRRKSSALQQEAIRGWERSFTVIAFPLPSVSPDRYEEIFDAVMEINTLDYMKYSRIQTALIDALNDADHVRVKGRYPNRTDLTVKLRQLEDPDRQAVFENCVADINIPVGEVFTSPVLEGTNGLLHVSKVYLEGLQYTDLAIRFKEGMTESYSCGNFADPAEGRKYIEDNILYHYPSLPMGECAIGTNTTAFAAARRYHIEALLPILIAEKTGPHFAVGDTCYAHDEDNRMFNPDGKEIVAKDNSWSARRKEDPEGAYFGCHTDITLPYDELAEYKAVYRDGREVMIIRDGRFVLPGTEELNAPLDRMEETE